MTDIPAQSVADETVVTISSGTAITGDINLNGRVLIGIVTPASWTTANLTFEASYDGSTFNDLYDEAGAEVTVVAGASRFIAVNPNIWFGIRHLHVRSGTTGTPVSQGADRDLTLVLGDATL